MNIIHTSLQIIFAYERTIYLKNGNNPDTFTHIPPTSCKKYTLHTNNEQDENKSTNNKKGAVTKNKAPAINQK